MAGIQCSTQLLYSAPALVFTKEKRGAGTQAGDPDDKKKKKKLTINTEEENVPNGSKVFTQMAELLYQRKKYRQALLVSDTAIELDEANKSPYATRAAALIRLGRYREALSELQQVKDPNNNSVLMLKSMASWYSGEFEEAAVSASRANRKRSQPPFFKEMFNTAIGSIEGCIGPSAGDILLESLKEIYQMEDERRRKAQPVTGTTQYCDITLKSDNRKSTVALINQAHRCEAYKKEFFLYLMQLHMGRLAISNRFLSELHSKPGFATPNEKGVERMNLLIKCAMKDLENRMEELMTDMPLYVYERKAQIKKSERLQELDQERHKELLARTKKHIEGMLIRVLAVRDKNIPMESLRASHRARYVIASLPKSLLPEKRMYLNIVYHLLGVALLEAKLKDPNLTEAENKNYLLGWLGIKSHDVIMKNSKFPFFDKASWLPWAMREYSLSPSHLERSWLLYVIAVCNAAYGNYDGCRNHIRRSVNEARATGSHIWAINGLVFQAHAELKLNGKLDAKNSIKEAIELAQELKDETIIASLVIINDAIDGQFTDPDTAAEERRFNRSLVAMMPTHAMKNEMRHILHHRQYMPKGRRLPIQVRRDTPPNLGDTAEDAEREQRPRLWPTVKKSV